MSTLTSLLLTVSLIGCAQPAVRRTVRLQPSVRRAMSRSFFDSVFYARSPFPNTKTLRDFEAQAKKQQALMMKVASASIDWEFKKVIQQNYKDGVLDLDGKVKGMDFKDIVIGTAQCPWIALSMKSYILSNNELTGQLPFDVVPALPPNVRFLDLSHNQLVADSLPDAIQSSNLEKVWLNNNKFDPDPDCESPWTRLPHRLQELYLHETPLKRPIDWQSLPETMRLLSVSANLAGISMHDKPDNWTPKNDSANAVVFTFESK